MGDAERQRELKALRAILDEVNAPRKDKALVNRELVDRLIPEYMDATRESMEEVCFGPRPKGSAARR